MNDSHSTSTKNWPAAILSLGKKKKPQNHRLFVPFEAFCSPWVIDDGWSDISGYACLGVSQRYAASLLPGCPTLLGPNEKSVTEHYMWKTESRHSRRVIKCCPTPPLTFLIWAQHRHALQGHQFITVPYTGAERVKLRARGGRMSMGYFLSQPHSHFPAESQIIHLELRLVASLP